MSTVSARPISSALAVSRSANRCRIRPRSAKPIRGQGPESNAVRAAPIARSISAVPPRATSANAFCVYGSMSWKVAPDSDSTSLPSMTCGMRSMSVRFPPLFDGHVTGGPVALRYFPDTHAHGLFGSSHSVHGRVGELGDQAPQLLWGPAHSKGDLDEGHVSRPESRWSRDW